MKILSEKRIVVENSIELQQALEEENTYTHIYLSNDITLTSGILIDDLKEKIVIDGTYLNTKHTLTGMVSSSSNDTIYVGYNLKKISIININIISPNPSSMIYVPETSDFKDKVVEYKNVTFNGTKLSHNPFGTTRIIDSIITIEKTQEIDSEEVAESNIVEISGKTTIQSSSVNSTLFTYLNNLTPTMTFLPNSRVTITTDTKELMTGTNKLIFSILHDAEVNLITGNGFSNNPVYGAASVLIDERANFNFIENKHQRVPFWTIYNSLTINKDASFSVINSYENTPTDNYNIHFKGSSPKINLNNPKSIVMYSKNANVIYTDNALDFNFTLSRMNLWINSTSLTSAGDINNLPDYSWYKEEGTFNISGQATSTTTYVTNHNFTTEEINRLPSLTNFHFQGKKQLSVGTSNLNIHPINTTSTKISGHTLDFADVLIEYNNTSNIVTADENGLFHLPVTTSIPDNTKIELTACSSSSFIYKKRIITTSHQGEMTLMNSTSALSFSTNKVSINPIILAKSKSINLKIVDSRIGSKTLNLFASISNHLTSKNNYKLEDALVFKKFNNEIITLSQTPALVYEETSTENIKVYNLTYSEEQGPLLNLDNNPLIPNEEYSANIVWTIN